MIGPNLIETSDKNFTEQATTTIVKALKVALAKEKTVNFVLTGGGTVASVYRALAGTSKLSADDWTRVRFFWGDERCVPPEHEQSNYRLALENLLQPLKIDESQVFRIPAEKPPTAAATEYADVINEVLDAGDAIDVLLLGMGNDGHVASLFPGTTALSERELAFVENYVPRLDSWRLTMTAPVIQAAKHVVVMTKGPEKARISRCVFAGQCTENEFPVRLLWQAQGQVDWVCAE